VTVDDCTGPGGRPPQAPVSPARSGTFTQP
jgi:hypothetical protein